MSRASDEESFQATPTNEPRLPLFAPAWPRECLRDLKAALSVLMEYSSRANREGLAYLAPDGELPNTVMKAVLHV
jgi:hypothetical protein